MTLAGRLVDRMPPWLGVVAILTGSVVLVALGFAACLGYQEARRVNEFQQLAEVTRSGLSVATQCMSTLQEVKPAEMILARQQVATSRQVPVALRDSVRERRWTSP